MHRPLLVVAVAVSFAIGSISYASGSAPEWVALKASVGLAAIGLMSWVVSVFAASSNQASDEGRGSKVDVTLPGATPSASREPETAGN